MKQYQITIRRPIGEGSVAERQNWRDLISSLVLSGYEVYGDEERIVFDLGSDDSITEREGSE